MGLMQLQLNVLPQSSPSDNVVMQRFMEQTRGYAQSVFDCRDLASESLKSIFDGGKPAGSHTLRCMMKRTSASCSAT